MNKLLIGIAQRLVHKAIEVNDKSYMIEVSFKYIGDSNAIVICLFNEKIDNVGFYFYDDNPHNRSHISQFRCILRKIRKRVL